MKMFQTQQTADQYLWERNRQDIENRFRSAYAIISNPNSNDGSKANAYYALFPYYQYGYGGVQKNSELALRCLKNAAELGHSQGCYEFIREYGQQDPQRCKRYIQIALSKINDLTFNSSFHNQKSMESALIALNLVYNPPQQSGTPIAFAFNHQQQRETNGTGPLSEGELFDILHPGVRENLRTAYASSSNSNSKNTNHTN